MWSMCSGTVLLQMSTFDLPRKTHVKPKRILFGLAGVFS